MAASGQFQFKLRSLLFVTGFIALLLAAVVRYVRPNVSGVSLHRFELVVDMTDEWTQWMFGDSGMINNPNDGPLTIHHSSYIAIPLHVVAVCVAFFGALSALVYAMLGRRRKI